MGLSWLIAGLLLPFFVVMLPPFSVTIILLASLLTLPALRTSPGLVILLTACAWSTWHIEDQRSNWKSFESPQTRTVQGRVASLPVNRGEYLEFQLVADDRDARLNGVRFLVRWYRNWPEVRAGQTWLLQLRLKPARSRVNFSGNGREPWFFAARIAALGHVDSSPSLRVAEPGQFDLLSQRERLSMAIGKVLDGHSAYPVIATLAVADRRYLDQAAWKRFNSTGTAHLLAISGLHIGIAAALGWWIGRLFSWLMPTAFSLRWSELACWFCSLATAFTYASLSGFPASTVRALVMLTCIALVKTSGRTPRPWRTLACALAIVLLLDPLAPLSAGLYLSFGAVAALTWAFNGRPGGQPWWRVLLRAQGAIMLFNLPLGMLLFQRASPGAFLANLLAIPWASVLVVPFAVLGTVLEPLFPGPSASVLILAAENMRLLTLALDGMAENPGFELLHTFVPSMWVMTIALAGAAIMLLPPGLMRRSCALVLMVPLLVRPGLKPQQARLDLLDSGQGFAATLRSGKDLLVYDSGPGDGQTWSIVPSVVGPAVKSARGDPGRIVISHGDLDHSGGLHELLRLYPRALFYGAFSNRRPRIANCLEGLGWNTGQANVKFLHPSPGLPYLGNDSSCVASVEIHGLRILFTGDITRTIEQRLVQEGLSQHDFLFVAHHGSKSSSIKEFIHTVGPSVALVSAASHNRYGLPHADVASRFAAIGAQFFSTSECGGMRLDIAETGSWRLSSARRLRRAPWRWPAGPSCP
ncbi:MAG: DNA internalization-related competence protein ComEC/Rec2 [Xanthomonadales bacterium]|nr:DNA internalization-related competence protein ComEC/Rec2 [Xanthomonadales bacterium]